MPLPALPTLGANWLVWATALRTLVNSLEAALTVTTQQSGTAYTLVLADGGTVVETTNAAAVTVTVPLNSSVAFPIGTTIMIRQFGAGQVTVAGTGVTLRARDGAKKTAGQYAALVLEKRGVDDWYVSGDVVV